VSEVRQSSESQWQRPYRVLKSILEQLGITPYKEELHPNAFESAYSVYKVSGEELRLVWDGKDGVGFLEHGAGQHWEMISPYLSRADIENPDKVGEFREAVQRFAVKR
jgi:hypothetical protein